MIPALLSKAADVNAVSASFTTYFCVSTADSKRNLYPLFNLAVSNSITRVALAPPATEAPVIPFNFSFFLELNLCHSFKVLYHSLSSPKTPNVFSY